jgi:UPF0755 protein
MARKRTKIIVATLALIVGLIVLMCFFAFTYRSNQPRTVVIYKGEGLKGIATKLQKEQVVSSSFVFTAYAIFTGNGKKIKAGQYEFSGVEGIPKIIDIVTQGKAAVKTITIIEGWNLEDIGEYLQSQNIGNANDFYKIAGQPLYLNRSLIREDCQGLNGADNNNYRDKYSFLSDKPTNIGLEGYLYPDTYQLAYDANIEAAIEKMLDNFDKKLTPEMRVEINRQNKTINEIVIMASLIEREVKTLAEKKIVSGILWKRLRIGMPMQVDSTILYSLGSKDRVSYIDTATCSPYNTYRRRGLPIGPISNPGIDSIIAAIYPQESDYLYYLSAKDGETFFSKTLEEHNVKKEKYLR